MMLHPKDEEAKLETREFARRDAYWLSVKYRLCHVCGKKSSRMIWITENGAHEVVDTSRAASMLGRDRCTWYPFKGGEISHRYRKGWEDMAKAVILPMHAKCEFEALMGYTRKPTGKGKAVKAT